MKTMQQRIDGLETSLEEMQEEMNQMKMNHAMELGFLMGVDEEG